MAVINKEIAYMALPLSIRRGNPFPIDEYSVWYDSGTSTTGTFTVNVTGVSWINAHVTFSVDNFSSDEGVAVELYRPDGTLAWSSLENVGDLITMDNREQTKWQGISFLSGQTGTYTVKYSIFNFAGNVPGSGRINCWIY